MEFQNLKNDFLSLSVAFHGAEIKSLKKIETGYEYMWQADSKYWGRTSPVLFPIVGNYKEKTSIYNGKSYQLSQHGFARDMDFVLESSTENSLTFLLKDSLETLEKYPFHFELRIKYILNERSLVVNWEVKNTNSETMYFSIGGHPAFNCNLPKSYLKIKDVENLVCGVLNSKGELSSKIINLPLEQEKLPLDYSLFDEDALIAEDNQSHEIILGTDDETNKGTDLLKVSFDAPVFGIWSPAGKNAPFVCIEPWYGRTDREDFNQKLEERQWGNKLEPNQSFNAEYTIEVL